MPLPNNPPVQALIDEQSIEGGSVEGEDSPSMRELAKQMDSHMEVIDLDNLTSLATLEGPGTLEITLTPTPQLSEVLPSRPP